MSAPGHNPKAFAIKLVFIVIWALNIAVIPVILIVMSGPLIEKIIFVAIATVNLFLIPQSYRNIKNRKNEKT